MFKVSARTLLHLGAELISSDAVAFYELIKNAFDAKAAQVTIDVVSRLDHEELESLRDLLVEERGKIKAKPDSPKYKRSLNNLRSQLVVDKDGHEAASLLQALEAATTFDALESALDAANYIVISDTGDGMSLQDLQDIYLTIGTPVRHKQREQQATQPRPADKSNVERPILGEKGIGRLSAMRLGWRLRVRTTKTGETHWNQLEIDWRLFTDLDKVIGEIEITPTAVEEKIDPRTKGTEIYISALATPWSTEKVAEIGRNQLSKFFDPFSTQSRFQIALRFNGETAKIQRLHEPLFEHAHMKITGAYTVNDGNATFAGKIVMKAGSVDRSTQIVRTMEQLRKLTESSDKVLVNLGPFRLVMYWFNRRMLQQIDGIGTQKEVRDLVKSWSGVMLFRDGVRIHPYGNADDDWLGFDPVALSRGGYKLNKTQFIGKIDITRGNNALLVDQANREGLKDTPEQQALVSMVHNLVQSEIWQIVNDWEKESKKADPAKEIKDRLVRVRKQCDIIIKTLGQLPEGDEHAELLDDVETYFRDEIGPALTQASQLVREAQDERETIIHLAGIGVLIESVAHELKKVTSHALKTVEKMRKAVKPTPDSRKFHDFLEILHAQLKTIEKKLRILDPHSTAGRQHKETFDIITWAQTVLDIHSEQLDAAKIRRECVVIGALTTWEVQMVKGVFVQILENLINNSIYWLSTQKQHAKGFRPELRIEIDPHEQTLKVIDNGPGIPLEQGDLVFKPFFTTRPPGESRGLGLYIARENAHYSNLEIDLLEEPVMHEGRYNTFMVSWPKQKASR